MMAFQNNYMMNELNAAVTITSPNHRPAPVYTTPLDFSHSPGDTNTTGTPTTRAKDNSIKILTSNCKIATIFFFLRNNIHISKKSPFLNLI
jgi:hypothetical protein